MASSVTMVFLVCTFLAVTTTAFPQAQVNEECAALNQLCNMPPRECCPETQCQAIGVGVAMCKPIWEKNAQCLPDGTLCNGRPNDCCGKCQAVAVGTALCRPL